MPLQCKLTAEAMQYCGSGPVAVPVVSRLCHASHLIQACDMLSLGLQGLGDYKAKYAVDEVHYTEDMGRVLSGLKPISVHLLCGTNTDR